jgi:Tol biopolymer transport system component/tRNA A-37 threonylcarbamoyl transferase component Bud32
MGSLTGQSFGHYQILEQIGEGGMAVVYKAYDMHLERNVAIKIIRRDAFPPNQLERILRRFEREAKSLAKLSHPNIVGVIDYGEHEGSPYLVMEYLPGGSLKLHLGKPIPWKETVRLLIPIANALEYAHEHNIIHRDIKPSNILLTEKGQPMLTDFGIAKILENQDVETLTGTGIGIGTPEYMAPEQWTGQTTAQSDIYSLGVVFYEMVTGRKPYEGDTPAEILLKQATDPLHRPKSYVPNLPDAIEKIILKALGKKANDRYEDMPALVNALEKVLDGKDSGKHVIAPKLADETVDEWETKTQTDPFKGTPVGETSPPRLSTFWLIGMGAVMIALICALFGWLGGGGSPRLFSILGPTSTPIGGGSGQIAYVSQRDQWYEIYIMNTDGSGQIRLADGLNPIWSPDGKKIVFTSLYLNKIYIMNADGSGRIRLAEGNSPTWSPDGKKISFTYSDDIYIVSSDGSNQTLLAEGWNPTWSPDGSKIAFVNGGIYTMNADGSGQTRLSDGWYPAWSPNGRQIAFSSYRLPDGPNEVHIMNADGSNQIRLAEGESPTWSPDGRQITFISDNAVYIMNADGSGQTRWYEGFPIWSPDGSKIAFTLGDYQKPEIYVMNPDGSGRTRLAEGSGPTWSPDGRQMAFTLYQPLGKSEIYIMDADGSGQTRLAEGGSPAWSPDGRQIAFTSDSAIYIMNADGSNQIRLAEGNSPKWSPDGRQIAFSIGDYQKSEIHIMNADGSNQKRLTEGIVPSWSPDGTRIAFTLYPEENIYIINADGSSRARLASGSHPTWSPDSARIAFVYGNFFGFHVINVDGSGEIDLSAGLGFEISWSPNNELIVFSSSQTPGTVLFTANAESSGIISVMKNITDSPDRVWFSPAWSPDGQQIAFVSDRHGNPEIYVMNSDASEQIRLTNNTAYDSSPAWRP